MQKHVISTIFFGGGGGGYIIVASNKHGNLTYLALGLDLFLPLYAHSKGLILEVPASKCNSTYNLMALKTIRK